MSSITIVSDATIWSITYDCHYDNRNSFYNTGHWLLWMCWCVYCCTNHIHETKIHLPLSSPQGDTMSFGQMSVGPMSWLKVNCSHPFTQPSFHLLNWTTTLQILMVRPTYITIACRLNDIRPIALWPNDVVSARLSANVYSICSIFLIDHLPPVNC